MAPLNIQTAPLHPFPGSSVPPLPTLPIILPPIALCAILLILYIRRPAAIVPTRPMATIKTPLLAGTTRAGTRVRANRRVGSYGGTCAPIFTSSDEGLRDGTGKGDGRPTHPRGRRDDKRPRLVRRDDEDSLVDASIPPREEERNPLSDSVPTLSAEHDSSDDQGPNTPDDETAPIHFRGDRVTKVKGVEVLEAEVVETPADERAAPVGMAVNVICV